MTRIVYVNGRYFPYAHARVHVEDRGFQFADAVYEVCEINNGRLVDLTRHLQRLDGSLKAVAIDRPMSDAALRHIFFETVRRNRVRHGTLYLQISRGQAPRDFPFPNPAVRPTVVCLARAHSRGAMAALAVDGIHVQTEPDPRWRRCDIKTVMLLPAVLAKQAARQTGAREVWFVDRDGLITEGASSTAWIITPDGQALTRPLSEAILPGVTRATVIDELETLGLQFEQRPFSVAEAERAREAFQTSASGTVLPVVKVNGAILGDGKPGALTVQLRHKFHQFAELA